MDFDLALATEVLERTPGTLRALLQNVSQEWARGTEGPDTFSPFDNIGHLIDGEETDWMPRARIILAQGKNRSGLLWFFISLFFGPFATFLIVVLPKA